MADNITTILMLVGSGISLYILWVYSNRNK